MKNNASFGLRLLATLTDFSLGTLINCFLLFYILSSVTLHEALLRGLLGIAFLLSPFGLFYSLGLVHYFQATPGKMLTGLKILGTDDKPLPFKMLFFRQLVGHLFSSVLFGLGYLAILKDPEKRAWHDKATNSKVVITQTNWFVALSALIIFSSASGYLLYQSIQTAISGPLNQETQTVIKSYQEEQKNAKVTEDKLKNPPEASNSAKTPQMPVANEFAKTQTKVYDHYDKKDFVNALKEANNLLKIAKTDTEKSAAYQTLGEVALAQNKNSEARKQSLEAVKLLPTNVYAYRTLTQVELADQNFPKAIEYAQKTIELNPKIAVYHNDLGVALFDSGKDKAKGIEEIKKAIELDPTSQLFKDNLKQMQGN